jgi:glyoxylase-like metal-dependent hydrolase (beta-lactamase superfamily II)
VRLKLKTIVSAPFEENTYLAWLDGRGDCLVIDPGLQPAKILTVLDSEQLVPAAILNTHGHSDHIAGNQALKDRWPQSPLVIGRLDAPKLTDPELNLSARFGLKLISPPADLLLDEGDTYTGAGFDLAVRHIPGHSIGHVVFIWSAGSPNFVFGGDVLFAGSIGRTDFPDGSFEQLAAGIREKLYSLPDDAIVLPGHGPTTTIGQEKQTNPFVPA